MAKMRMSMQAKVSDKRNSLQPTFCEMQMNGINQMNLNIVKPIIVFTFIADLIALKYLPIRSPTLKRVNISKDPHLALQSAVMSLRYGLWNLCWNTLTPGKRTKV